MVQFNRDVFRVLKNAIFFCLDNNRLSSEKLAPNAEEEPRLRKHLYM